ncbi:MAG: PAS domain S-box protein [Pseudomonadales bacterium]|nr:PAS domain S-box protein [Pseudomonadales bacterium]
MVETAMPRLEWIIHQVHQAQQIYASNRNEHDAFCTLLDSILRDVTGMDGGFIAELTGPFQDGIYKIKCQGIIPSVKNNSARVASHQDYFQPILSKKNTGHLPVWDIEPETVCWKTVLHSQLPYATWSTATELGLPSDLDLPEQATGWRVEPILTGAQIVGIVCLWGNNKREDEYPDKMMAMMLSTAALIQMDVRDRRNMEEASLMLAKANLRLAFQRSALDEHAIVSLTDKAGVITYVNKKFCEISGFTERELIGKKHNIINSGHHSSAFFTRMWAKISSGDCWQGEICNVRKDGELYWVATTIVPNVEPGRGIIEYISIRTDITQLKLMEQKLSRESSLLRAVVDSIVDGIVACDSDGRASFANPAAQRMLGMLGSDDAAEAWAQSKYLFYPESDRALSGSDGPLAKVLSGEEQVSAFHVVRVPGTEEKLVRSAGRVLRDEHRHVIGGLLTIHDMTAKRRSEEIIVNIAQALSASPHDAFFETLVASIGSQLNIDYVLIGTYDSALGKVNVLASTLPGDCAALSYSISDTPCELVVGIEGQPGTPGSVLISRDVMRRFPKDQDLVDLEIEAYIGAPIIQQSGGALGILAALYRRPIEHGAIEKTILEVYAGIAARELERRQYEKEQQALQQQLLVSQKMEAMGQLSGGIAHDFNNLLGIILGNLDLLEAKVETEQTRKYIEKAIKACERGSEMTRRLLALSKRRDSGPAAPLDLNNSIHQVFDLLQKSLTGSIVTELLLDDALWLVEIRPGELENILINLAINSRDAMPKGGTITLSSMNLVLDDVHSQSLPLSPGNYVYLEFADNGEGISNEHLTHIFEPFYTTKSAGGGTGLGLAMVFMTVKQRGGYVSATSQLGCGTTFSIWFPAVTKPDLAATTPVSATAETALVGKLILIVDDEEEIRTMLSTILSQAGCQVVAVQDFVDAELALRKHDFDLIITDVILPGSQDGISWARQVGEQRKSVKIILMSGYNAAFYDEQQLKALEFPYLTKPFRRRDVLQQIQNALYSVPNTSPPVPGK